MLEIGKNYYVRNPAADNLVGRLVAIIDPFTLELEEAAWIADTGGRTSEFVANGRCEGMEVERPGRVITRYQSVVEWNHPCFTESH